MTPELHDLFKLLSFPSISTDPTHRQDVQACAEWLTQWLAKLGLHSRLCSTPGHPVVLAKTPARPGTPKVLLYGHYDVQPVDPLELWHSPPFQPEIRKEKIYARGATDNKGQFFSHLCGLQQLLADARELPVELTILLEGEEEIGSPHLSPFLKEHQHELQTDLIVVSDTGMVAPGVPTLGYGLRGIACWEVDVRGPASDLHSGLFGGAIVNPLQALTRLLHTLHDESGRVAVPGFYENVTPLPNWERANWKSVPGASDPDFLRLSGAPALGGENGYSAFERVAGRPTLEFNGLGGGYQGEGSKTVLPSHAFAKLSARLVAEQDPAEILTLVTRHLQAHAPRGVEVTVREGHTGPPYQMDPHSPYGQAAQRALKKTFDTDPVLIREGGSIPIIPALRNLLGADTLMLGLALPDAHIHAPNENFPLAHFQAGIRLHQHLLTELAP